MSSSVLTIFRSDERMTETIYLVLHLIKEVNWSCFYEGKLTFLMAKQNHLHCSLLLQSESTSAETRYFKQDVLDLKALPERMRIYCVLKRVHQLQKDETVTITGLYVLKQHSTITCSDLHAKLAGFC